MKKIFSVLLICLLLLSQTKAFAIDVVIDDPTPDLVAPYINDISVSSNELSPLNPVIVEAEMVDELSGFNSGSITFTKSSNQTLTVGFVENSQSGKHEALISAKDVDVAGEWKVTDIFLKDNKDNTVHLSNLSIQTNGEKIDLLNLTLNVSGVTPPPVSSDKEPPVIHTIAVESKDLSVNDTVSISAEISDNDSGVSTVIANYQKPSGDFESIYLYENSKDIFTGSHTIGKYEESGEWKLTSVYVRDRDGNSSKLDSYIDKDNNQKNFNDCTLNIVGTTVDIEAPILKEISVTSNEVSPNKKIEVRAVVTDNESGVSSVRVNYKNSRGNFQSIYLYRKTENEFVGSRTISQFEERGESLLVSVILRDVVGNEATITNYKDINNDLKSFEHCTVNVVGTTPDWEAPEFTGGKISVSQVSPQQAAVKLFVEVEDNLSGIEYSKLYGSYKKPSGKMYSINFIKMANQYTARYTLISTMNWVSGH
ncbi:hypothetical protein LCD52_17495 [Rossellomorea vietnamensis]|uniref:hypothetical protein n=1 Tax=Rossellomorea vietnamensis TaxID=218284 RepID=UPI001CD0297D|nr:hypothetical protein [Rossellomorea vietnamensis]MCA0150555.1 hypothetical protein [Rossellomorea vietnamensis]